MKHKSTRILCIILLALWVLLKIYLLCSIGISIAYHFAPYSAAWDIAEHRNGLLLFAVEKGEIWLLNPLTNYGDDWLFGFTADRGMVY